MTVLQLLQLCWCIVQGLGHLPTSTTPEQSIQLKALCLPNPGQLDKTTNDPEKCAAWQLGPSQFQCSNPGQNSCQTPDQKPSQTSGLLAMFWYLLCIHHSAACKAQRDEEQH